MAFLCSRGVPFTPLLYGNTIYYYYSCSFINYRTTREYFLLRLHDNPSFPPRTPSPYSANSPYPHPSTSLAQLPIHRARCALEREVSECICLIIWCQCISSTARSRRQWQWLSL